MSTDDADRPAGLERELAELTRHLQFALETARLHVYSWDLETGVIEGQNFSDSPFYTGGTRYETTHEHRLGLVHPEDRDAYEAAMRAAIESGPDQYRLEFRFAPVHGEDRWFEHRGHVVRNEAGKARRVECVSFEVTERHRRERELDEAYAQLRLVSRRLDRALEDERRELARRLHDELAQGLTALALHLGLLVDPVPGEDARERGAQMQRLLEEQLDFVRQLSGELRPPLLDELGLVPALQSYLASQRKHFGIDLELSADEHAPRAPAEVESTAFRVVQEAVVNAIRHAHAKRIRVAIARRDGGLGLRVADDGGGFDVDEALRRDLAGGPLGLLRLRKLASVLEGRVTIESAPGRGTAVDVWLPCAQGAEGV
jgi:PAS domain S-box-containing protein